MRYLALICLLLIPATAEATWHRAETDNFIVYMDDDADDVREMAIELEQLHHAMRSLNNVTAENSPVKLRVFVLMSQRSIQRLGRRSHGLAGFYRPAMRGSYMVVPRQNIGFGRFATPAREILYHEYGHHFLLQFFPANYPPWFVEGFAEFYSTLQLQDGNRVEIGHPVASRSPALHRSSWIPFETLFSNEAASSDMAYSQGWLFMHYAYFRSETRAVLRRYLDAMREGTGARDAYAQTFALTGIDYDRELQAYRDGRLPILALTVEDSPDIQVELRAMSEIEAQATLLYIHENAEGVARAHALIDDHPEVAQAHVELSRMLIEMGDYETGLAAAERALAIEPDHIEGHLFKGMALSEIAWDSGDDGSPLWATARNHIARANRADPDSALALYAFYNAYPNDTVRPAVADEALEVAFTRVPQSPELRSTMVEELLRQRRFDLAMHIGIPLVQADHGQGRNSVGETLLARLREIISDLRNNEHYAENGNYPIDLYVPRAQDHGAMDLED